MSTTIRGSCLCGGIAYRAEEPIFKTSHCFCSMCRKQHGAAAGSYVNVHTAGFVVERGKNLLVEYESSEFGRRGFCKKCGSSLTFRSTDEPERIALDLGGLDTEYGEALEREWFTERKPAWMPVK
jgi:hypothetical protein